MRSWLLRLALADARLRVHQAHVHITAVILVVHVWALLLLYLPCFLVQVQIVQDRYIKTAAAVRRWLLTSIICAYLHVGGEGFGILDLHILVDLQAHFQPFVFKFFIRWSKFFIFVTKLSICGINFRNFVIKFFNEL